MVAVALISSLLQPKQLKNLQYTVQLIRWRPKARVWVLTVFIKWSMPFVLALHDILKYLVSDISAVFHTQGVIEIS